MSVTEQGAGERALSREWLAARIVVIGGLVLAAALVAFFGWIKPTYLTAPQLTAEQQEARATALAIRDMCTTGIAAAKAFGILPSYGHLASPNAGRTDVQGRYVCVAGTQVAKYLVAVELLCRDLKDRRCVSLYSVTQDDGTVLYQRQG
jgi:hypothetical protein